MLRSLFSGISGLRQHQTMMDVTGNNIANVNTTGYKSSAVTFQDTLSQTMKNAGAPAGGLGGTNPTQVGLGVKLGSISTNFSQGSTQTTGVSTNLMIQGDGFFMVNNGSEDLYTRAGAFTFDTDGRMTNGEGMIVQGWMGEEGVVNTNAPTTGIQIPTGTIIPPVASRNVTVEGNLGVTNQVGDVVTLTAKLYDEQGQAHNVTSLYTMTAASTYSVQLQEGGVNIGTPGTISFDSTGAVASKTDATVQFGTSPVVTWDMEGMRQYGGTKSLAITKTDGSQAATLEGFQVSPDGTVTGIFSNGLKQSLAQVALANFNNPNGLEKVGGSNYRSTVNSGLVQMGTANSGGRGGILANSVEMSNVDLGQEFTNLIIAQRGFQANSKVITTSDQMLEELVNLKR